MDLTIDEFIDKGLYYKKLSNDKVINITGEGGSGKSTLANEYKNDPDYLVVDYDLILLDPGVGTIEYELKQMLLEKYGNTLFENIDRVGLNKVKENFTTMYNEIINYLSNKNKTIVLDGTQLRFISDPKMIKGEFVALRPSLQTCLSQSVNRFIQNNPQATSEQIKNYSQKRANVLRRLNPMMNDLLTQVDALQDVKDITIPFDSMDIQNNLLENAKKYLGIIKNEYSAFMSPEQITFLNQLIMGNCISVDKNGEQYLLNQSNEINKSNMTPYEKLEELRKLNIPLAHGGRVFEDNKIHFYPSILLPQNPNLSNDELIQKCNEVLIHELLHFFIRPQNLDVSNLPELKGINNFTTEGLVDMCARDIQQKYGLFPNYNSEYGSNVLFVREALGNGPSLSERMKLVFNGSIEQIYAQTSTKEYDSKRQFIDSRDKKTKFDQVVQNISKICFNDPKQSQSCQRFLYNFSANYKSKDEALKKIDSISQQQFPDKLPLIRQEMVNYTNSGINKLQNNNAQLDSKKSFDERTDGEIKVAEQIREKNKLIAQQKQQQKQQDKPKTLVKTNPNTSSTNKGYINVVVLSLIISFVAGMLFMVVYSLIR